MSKQTPSHPNEVGYGKKALGYRSMETGFPLKPSKSKRGSLESKIEHKNTPKKVLNEIGLIDSLTS